MRFMHPQKPVLEYRGQSMRGLVVVGQERGRWNWLQGISGQRYWAIADTVKNLMHILSGVL